MLSIASHSLILRDRILEFIVHQVIEIDAELVEDDEHETELLFDLDDSVLPDRQLEMAEKLDNIMNRVFHFLDQEYGNDRSFEELFRAQLRVFHSSILPTQKSKHPQFIIFFICAQSNAYSQQFLGYLCQKIIDKESSQFEKTTAIGYIASFIARAKFATYTLIHSTMVTLCNWAYIYAKENSGNFDDFVTHQLFYHLCQAIFYMLCFRFEQILDRTTKEECLATFHLIDIIHCSLNPFKYCSPIVVKELTEISHTLNIVKLIDACDTVLKRNNALVSTARFIEASFPFDPYLLKNSSQWVNDFYCSWEERAIEEVTSYSEDFDLSASVPEDFDVVMSFTPDASYDISMHFPRSPC